MNDEQWKKFSKSSGEDLDSYMYHDMLFLMADILGCSDREADIICGKLRDKNITVSWKLKSDLV